MILLCSNPARSQSSCVFVLIIWIAFMGLFSASASASVCLQNPINVFSKFQKIQKNLQLNTKTYRHEAEVIKLLKDNQFLEYLDKTAIANRLLPRGVWGQATKQEQENFSNAFMVLISRMITKQVNNIHKYEIKRLPMRKALQESAIKAGVIQVPFEVIYKANNAAKPATGLIYLAKSDADSCWLVQDIAFEGVSITKVYQDQLASVSSIKQATKAIDMVNARYANAQK